MAQVVRWMSFMHSALGGSPVSLLFLAAGLAIE